MKRMANFDALRIFMAFMVVVLHISAGLWSVFDVSTIEFKQASLLNNMVRSTVPIFVMISGYFSLNKSFNFKRDFKKALHLFSLFVFWSAFYAFLGYGGEFSLRGVLESIVNGKYHLWFLLNLTWCYLLTPVAHALKNYEDGRFLKYIMGFFFVFGVLKLTISNLLNMSEHYFIGKFFNHFSLFYYADMLNYFILGYYLSTIKVNIKNRYLVLAYIAMAIINTYLTNYYSVLKSKPVGEFIDYYNVLVFFESVILFTIFKNLEGSSFLERNGKFLGTLSNLTFGVFLLHPLYLDILNIVDNPILRSYPTTALLFALVVYLVCSCVTFVALKIPVLKKLFR